MKAGSLAPDVKFETLFQCLNKIAHLQCYYLHLFFPVCSYNINHTFSKSRVIIINESNFSAKKKAMFTTL
jgi:hypothetical protein